MGYNVSGYEDVGVFPTQSKIYDMVCDKKYLYTIEDNATVIRKYKLFDTQLVDTWNFYDGRADDELFICKITVNEKWIIVINFVRSCVILFTKDGKYLQSGIFNFLIDSKSLDFQHDCMEMSYPINERADILKKKFYSQLGIMDRIKFYSVAANNKYIVISMYVYFIILSIDNAGVSSYDVIINRLDEIYDVVAFKNHFVFRYSLGVGFLVPTKNSAKIMFKPDKDSPRKFMLDSNYGGFCDFYYGSCRFTIYNGMFLLKTGSKFQVFNMEGQRIGNSHNHNVWTDKFYIIKGKIYILTYSKDIHNLNVFGISILKLKYI